MTVTTIPKKLSGISALADQPRRFPPPWSVDEADSNLDRRSFIVCDANGQALAYVYFEEERGRRAAAHPNDHYNAWDN